MSARNVLITGGARGIGAALADRFRAAGDQVLTPARADMDLLQPASIDAWLDHLAVPVDVLINNAGINVLGSTTEFGDDDVSAMLQVNVLGPLHLARRLAVGMVARRFGRILNISSIFSVVTKPRRVLYSLTKSAINGLTRSLAVEFAPHGVLVNALAPGYVETALTAQNNTPQDIEAICATIPARRLAQPEEMAEVAWFLCSDANSYLTGQVIVADGGFTCL